MDNSGVRLTVTPTLRPHDAGILEISAFVDKSQVIPPYQQSFVTTAFCPTACMHQVRLNNYTCDIVMLFLTDYHIILFVTVWSTIYNTLLYICYKIRGFCIPDMNTCTCPLSHPLYHTPFITPPFGTPLYFSRGLPRGFST